MLTIKIAFQTTWNILSAILGIIHILIYTQKNFNANLQICILMDLFYNASYNLFTYHKLIINFTTYKNLFYTHKFIYHSSKCIVNPRDQTA